MSEIAGWPMAGLDLGSAWIDLGSILIALAAVGLSIYSAWRLAIAEGRRQFADLERMFFQVFQSLPEDVQTRHWEEYTKREQNAAELYWNLAYLEWRASKASGSKVLEQQWEDYYQHVQVSGFRHPGLRRGLEQRLRNDPALSQVWNDYLADLQAALEDYEKSDRKGFFQSADEKFEFLRSQILKRASPNVASGP